MFVGDGCDRRLLTLVGAAEPDEPPAPEPEPEVAEEEPEPEAELELEPEPLPWDLQSWVP